ncbi:MAG: TIGR01777 family protein [Planctomycetes bacterium]|nr:TIGR01777 family protein [Planctomycetota bacterium]
MIFTYRSVIDAPADAVFDWHCRPGALERLSPGSERIVPVARLGGVADNGVTTLRVKIGPFWKTWVAQHAEYNKYARSFKDKQTSGPFKRWEHTHCVIPANSDACVLEDRIEYNLGFGSAVDAAAKMLVIEPKLRRVFRYRHTIVASDVRRHLAAASPPMRIGVTGATGLVGEALCAFLSTGGHTVIPFARPGRPSPGFLNSTISWNPDADFVQLQQLEGFDAIVHLAGENIASKRWSAKQKEIIRRSRVEGTQMLCGAIAKLQKPPRVLVCASAVGYYGNRGSNELDESSHTGFDYLAKLCADWERASAPAAERGVRVVNLRFGVILSSKGGALAKMLPPFRLGAGGRIGSGDQWMSWISHYDAVAAIHHAIYNNTVRGPANTVAPHAATNSEFTKTLGRVLRRPAIAPLPAAAVQIVFGEIGDALLLGGQRVVPRVLLDSGFRFEHARLEDALRFELLMN